MTDFTMSKSGINLFGFALTRSLKLVGIVIGILFAMMLISAKESLFRDWLGLLNASGNGMTYAGLFFLIVFAASFALFYRYAGTFRFSIKNGTAHIQKGLFLRRHIMFDVCNINHTSVTRGSIHNMLNTCTVNFFTQGNADKSLFIPFLAMSELDKNGFKDLIRQAE